MIRQQKLCLLDWKRRTRRLIVAADHYASSYFDSKASPRGGVSSRQQRRGRKFMAETNRIHRTTSKSCGNQETQQKTHLRNRKILLCTALRQHLSVAKGPHIYKLPYMALTSGRKITPRILACIKNVLFTSCEKACLLYHTDTAVNQCTSLIY
jgi:hypothetical protein